MLRQLWAHALQNALWPKLDKLCRRTTVRLHLIETDTRHCPGYLAGIDLIMLSWRAWSKICKKKFGDDTEGFGRDLASLPLFFWKRRSRGAVFFVGLPTSSY